MTNSLLDLKFLTRVQLEKVFFLAREIKRAPLKPEFLGQTAALLFFEPSTRTRLSFESACVRAGLGPLVFQGGAGTSMEKGESLEDTLMNVAAMKPAVIVLRAGDDFHLSQVARELSMPILNAGWGRYGHPTQALLDLFTIHERKSLEGLKILFVGDIAHSRVAASHFEILPLFNAQVGICGPESLLPKESNFRKFSTLREGLSWADAVVCLRYQLERHDSGGKDLKQEIRQSYAFTKEMLPKLPKDTLILHPGPVNQSVEMDAEVYRDERSLILDQVSHGVWLREALLRLLLKGDWV